MLTDAILIDTTIQNGTSLSSNLFGYRTPDLSNNTNYSFLPESDLSNTYVLYVYGAQYITERYDGTVEYRRYDIDSISNINTSELAPNLNVDISPFTTTSGDGWEGIAFAITFTGSLENATFGAVTMTYRDGLNAPVTVNNINSLPSTASITNISRPNGVELIPLQFSITAEGNNYTLQTPLYVMHEQVIFPEQSAPKSSSRKGDKETGHGYSVKGSSQGSDDVFIDGKKAHTSGHTWPDHNKGDSWHRGRSTTTGSGSVYINGAPMARVSDSISSDSISCGSQIAQGSETVFSG